MYTHVPRLCFALSGPLRPGYSPSITDAQPSDLRASTPMITLLVLLVVVLLVSLGQLTVLDIDLSAFPGGIMGVLVLVVVALLVTRRI